MDGVDLFNWDLTLRFVNNGGGGACSNILRSAANGQTAKLTPSIILFSMSSGDNGFVTEISGVGV